MRFAGWRALRLGVGIASASDSEGGGDERSDAIDASESESFLKCLDVRVLARDVTVVLVSVCGEAPLRLRLRNVAFGTASSISGDSSFLTPLSANCASCDRVCRVVRVDMELEVDVVLASAREVSWEIREVRMAARPLCRYVMVVKRSTSIQKRNFCSTRLSQAN
jgi:hypothetical protein